MTTPRPPPTPPSSAISTRPATARLESYKELLRIPSISALPQHFEDCRATAEWIAADLRPGRHRERRRRGHDRPPGRLRRLAPRRRRPDGHRLLPLRRPAGRPARPVGLAAVRAGRCRRPDARPRRGRRQGPDPPPPSGRSRRSWRRAAASRSTSGSSSRATRSRPRPRSRAGWRRNRERLEADLVVISDTGFFEGNLPAITISLRGMMYAQIDVTGSDRRPPLRRLRRGRRQPGQRPCPDHHRAQGSGRPRPHPRLLRRRRGPHRRGAPAARRAAVRRGGTTAPTSACPRWPASRGSASSSARARARRSTSTASGAGSRATGAKTIIPAHAHAKVSCRLVTAQDPDRVFAALKAFVEEIAPPSVRRQRDPDRRRAAEPHPDRPSGDARRRARARGDVRAGAAVHPRGWLDPGLRGLRGVLGLPVVLLGFSPPDDHAHAPNEWMDLANYETGIRTIVRTWDEIAALDPSSLRAT